MLLDYDTNKKNSTFMHLNFKQLGMCQLVHFWVPTKIIRCLHFI